MSLEIVNQIAKAVLYEGYLLYPYRRSAIKNQQRWNFGVLYPRSYAEAQSGHDAWSMQAECLAVVKATTELTVRVRFLQLINRRSNNSGVGSPERSANDGFDNWQEAIEREVNASGLPVGDIQASPKVIPFCFMKAETISGDIFEDNQTLRGEVIVSAVRVEKDLCRVRVVVKNGTAFDGEGLRRDEALMGSLLSTHIVFALDDGEFISLLDPSEELRSVAAACTNIGCWPVMVGGQGDADTMLASPIILYDYPKIAAESAGDLFDGTEIDEILSLRIMTLTDDEKREMRSSDERARQILERTESMPVEQFMKLHGVLRSVNRKS